MDSDTVVGPLIGRMTQGLFNVIGRRVGYVVHCNQNIKELLDGADTLRAEVQTIQGSVDGARDNADEIEVWLLKAGALLKELDQFLVDRGNLKCCNGWCPNIRARHRVGKEAKNKLKDVVQLTERGKFDNSVGHRPPSTDTDLLPSVTDYSYFDSRASICDEIIGALGDDSVYIIGICGMGGVGKTTMADQVSKKAKDMKIFEEVAKVVVSHDPDYRKIQQDLAACLNLTLDNESQSRDASLLRSRLKNGRKILLIIDDVWNKIGFDEIGIPPKDYTHGCKILFTTRNMGVCSQMEVEKYFRIEVLSEVQAWYLFKSRVGNTIDSPQIHYIAKEVCNECAGLPLLIVTLGAALRNKKPHAWRDTLAQLRNRRGSYMGESWHRPIELSYEYLEHPDAKACFLCCCLYPEDAEISIEQLVWYGVGTRFLRNRDAVEAARERVHGIVNMLKKSCLLKEGSDENFVKVHDVIRDVGRSIASRKTELMELVNEQTRISLRLDYIKALQNESECPGLLTSVLEYIKGGPVPPGGVLKAAKKIEALYLRDMRLLTAEYPLLVLANLEMLCLRRCQLKSLDFLKKLEKLEMLCINDCNIETLTLELEKLTRLRVLDLRGCGNLRAISEGLISSFSGLEELYVPEEFDKWGSEGNSSLDELNTLRYLTNLEAHIPAEALLSQGLRCESLSKFKVSIGSRLSHCESSRSKTKTLKLEGIELFDGAEVLIERAEALYLVDLKGLQKIFDDRNGEWFSDLKFFLMEGCNDEMEHLLGKPKWNSQIMQVGGGPRPLSKLSVLKVLDCRLRSLFFHSVAKDLPQLQELVVNGCESMSEIVGPGDQLGGDEVLTFPKLTKMKLEALPNVRTFLANTKTTNSTAQPLFNGKVNFPVLKELIVGGLKSITAILDDQFGPGGLDDQFGPGGADSFSQLQMLMVYECDKLVNVVSSSVHAKLKALLQLDVRSCVSLTSVVEMLDVGNGSEIQQEEQQANDSVVALSSLRSIKLTDLPNLKRFCSFQSKRENKIGEQILEVQALFNHKVSLPVLKYLEIMNLQSITAVWDYQREAQDSFGQLRTLNVYGCAKLLALSPSHLLPCLENLRNIDVRSCVSVEFLVREVSKENDQVTRFSRLEKLTLVSLSKLQSFCHSSHDNEEYTFQVQALFNHKVLFPKLEQLEILNLESITTIWEEPVNSFQRLRRLHVSGCGKVMDVVIPSHVLPRLQKLKIVEVSSCDSLKFLVGKDSKEDNNPFPFSQLEKLTISSLPNLKGFCSSSNSRNDIWPVLFNHKVLFPVLTYLSIRDLKNITAIWDHQFEAQQHSFQLLRTLNVQGCGKLVAVVPSQMTLCLQGLRELEVSTCHSMEFLVGKDPQEDGQVLEFPQLERVSLEYLPKLKTFCNTPFDSTEDGPQALFNHKIILPCLMDLKVRSIPQLREIWDTTIQTNTPSKLEWLTVENCDNLLNVAPSKLLKSFCGLHGFMLKICPLLTEMFRVDASSAEEEIAAASPEEENNLLFPQLEHIKLYHLPSLRSINSELGLHSKTKLEVKECPILEKELAMII